MERGTLIAGKYELGERLGRGGMGEVWAGRDRDLHRSVAIASEFRWGPRYIALSVQSEGREPQISSISPAGMVHPRSPQGTAGRLPLCALGPMTEQQHQALVDALARHAGSRWKPELSR